MEVLSPERRKRVKVRHTILAAALAVVTLTGLSTIPASEGAPAPASVVKNSGPMAHPHFVAPHPRPKPRIAPRKKVTKKKVTYVGPRISGIQPSAYRGPYYDARFEAYRRCVVKRESEGQYYAVDPSGAAGAYQFMPPWTKTLQSWTGHHVPIQQMTRYEQDYAFWRAFDHGKGASAWAGGRWYCGF